MHQQKETVCQGLLHRGLDSAFLRALVFLFLLSFLWNCSRTNSAASPEEEACLLCHSQEVGQSSIHQTHVNSMLKMEHPFFKSNSSESDSLIPLNDTTVAQMYSCQVCHSGYKADGTEIDGDFHGNGHVDVVFDSVYFDSVFQFTGNMSFNKNTCSNVPCHGGDREGKGGVVWATSVKLDEELDCSGCHETSDHVTRIRCGVCHNITALNDSTIINYDYHVNGIEEDKF